MSDAIFLPLFADRSCSAAAGHSWTLCGGLCRRRDGRSRQRRPIHRRRVWTNGTRPSRPLWSYASATVCRCWIQSCHRSKTRSWRHMAELYLEFSSAPSGPKPIRAESRWSLLASLEEEGRANALKWDIEQKYEEGIWEHWGRLEQLRGVCWELRSFLSPAGSSSRGSIGSAWVGLAWGLCGEASAVEKQQHKD